MKLTKKKGCIFTSPFVDIEVYVGGCKPPNNPKDEIRVYLPEEIEKLFHQLRVRLGQNPDETDSYVVFLLFKLGLRIGETVVLKWSDTDWETRKIYIDWMESRMEDEKGKLQVVIVEFKMKNP